ncbi:MAG: ATP12 chaperone family protein [Alphaproteobacteria bacterium]|nr:ATP12 chaperone family protein [Alphaproteobacteria bacterium]MCD8525930.1 ATP12 chaperone family protein [Alphaproteobacteria bacterium]MCD8570455.1 ATP12 chaperone family protein [Alphaproteobacteria bacterium]
MKRFYKMVSFKEEPGGYAICLDGRPVKTPARHTLIAPHQAMAEALQAEWAAQGDEVKPESMPLTQLLNTHIDKVREGRGEMEALVLKYLDTDLLCYRCEEPPEVATVQNEHWNKWLDWFEKIFEERLETTSALAAIKHPASAHEKVAAHVKSLDDAQFTVLQMAVPLSGSLILGLAFANGAASPDQMMDAMFAEENYKGIYYKEDQYGPDPLTEKKRIAAKRDLEGAARFLALQ